MAPLLKRSVTIRGHRTSLSLEPLFWHALTRAARREGLSVNELVTQIDTAREVNLSSAIRCWLFERLQNALTLAQGNDDQSGERDERAEDSTG